MLCGERWLTVLPMVTSHTQLSQAGSRLKNATQFTAEKFQAAAHQPQPPCEFHIWGHTYEWSTTHQPREAYVPWGCWCTVLDVLLSLFVCISFIIAIVNMICLILFTIFILILAIARVETSGSRSSWLPPYLESARHPMQHHSWSATNCQLLYRQSRDWKRVVVSATGNSILWICFKYAELVKTWLCKAGLTYKEK